MPEPAVPRDTRAVVLAADGEHGRRARFELTRCALPPLAPGDVAVRVDWLSIDPFLHLRIAGAGWSVPQCTPGTVMPGRGAGVVLASRHPAFSPGDEVTGDLGWQEVAVVPAAPGLRAIRRRTAPLEAYLGVLGPTGLAAWFLLAESGAAPGERLAISGAAGGVGAICCRLALERGCRVVGVCRGPAECAHVSACGVEDAVDTSSDGWEGALARAAGEGLQVALDGIGGAVFDAFVANAATHARLIVFGALASYGRAASEDVGPRPQLAIALKRLAVRGFLLADHATPEALGAAERALAERLADGRLHTDATVVEGLHRATEAFAGVLDTPHIGKLLVRLRS